MRPFGDVISLEAARDILDATGIPIDTHRHNPSRAGQRTCRRARHHRRLSCAALLARGDGRLRGSRRRHARRLARRAADAATIGVLFTGQMPDSAGWPGRVHRDFDRRADARRRRRRGHGRRNGSSADARVQVFAEVQPAQNVGRRGADIRPGQVVVSAGETLNSSRVGALAAIGTSRVDVYRAPARRDSFDGQRGRRARTSRSGRGRSTTSTASRLPRSSRRTAVFRTRIHPPPTRSTR